MKSRILLMLAAVLLVAAANHPTAQDLVRRANAAFSDGDFQFAIDLLTEAEDITTDPGLIAFNKAAAYFKMGDYRNAESHYLCALEDAEGERRARASYDLGNSLVKQADDKSLRILARSIEAYVECLHMELSESLFDDARNNLQIAIGLLRQARANTKGDPDKPSDEEKSDPKKEDPKKMEKRFQSAEPDNKGDEQKVGMGDEGDLSQEAKQSRQSQPGRSPLPPIPENERMVPMSAEDTAAYLRKEADRILDDRQRQKVPVPYKHPPHVPLW